MCLFSTVRVLAPLPYNKCINYLDVIVNVMFRWVVTEKSEWYNKYKNYLHVLVNAMYRLVVIEKFECTIIISLLFTKSCRLL